MKRKTNKLNLAFAALIGALCLTATASAVTIELKTTDIYYLGSIADGIPSSEANELNWVNEIIGMGLDTSQASTNPAGETLYRSPNGFGSLGAAIDGVKQEDDGTRTIGPMSTYVLGKYGASSGGQVSYVWYVGGLDEGTIVELGEAKNGLSHSTLFNSSAVSVPDGGATVALLGLSLLGLGGFRRKLKA